MAKHADDTLIFDDVSPYIREIKSLRKAVTRYKKKAARANQRADKNLALYQYTLGRLIMVSGAVYPALDWLNNLTQASGFDNEPYLLTKATPRSGVQWADADTQARRGHDTMTKAVAEEEVFRAKAPDA